MRIVTTIVAAGVIVHIALVTLWPRSSVEYRTIHIEVTPHVPDRPIVTIRNI